MSYQVDVITQSENLLVGTVTQTSAKIDVNDTKEPVTVPRNIYLEYNFFVRHYNDDANRVDNIYMKHVPDSRLFRKPSSRDLTILMIFALIPFVCILIIIGLHYRGFLWIKFMIICAINKQAVRDPFRHMIYCATLKKLNYYFEIGLTINYEELAELGISTQDIDNAAAQYRDKIQQGKTLRVMFYNNQFACFQMSNEHSDRTPMHIYFLIILSVVGFVLSLVIIISIV